MGRCLTHVRRGRAGLPSDSKSGRRIAKMMRKEAAERKRKRKRRKERKKDLARLTTGRRERERESWAEECECVGWCVGYEDSASSV